MGVRFLLDAEIFRRSSIAGAYVCTSFIYIYDCGNISPLLVHFSLIEVRYRIPCTSHKLRVWQTFATEDHRPWNHLCARNSGFHADNYISKTTYRYLKVNVSSYTAFRIQELTQNRNCSCIRGSLRIGKLSFLGSNSSIHTHVNFNRVNQISPSCFHSCSECYSASEKQYVLRLQTWLGRQERTTSTSSSKPDISLDVSMPSTFCNTVLQ
eukprot:SAG31_NODE_70_length_28117_cov_100.521843_17_plen_210_part_00